MTQTAKYYIKELLNIALPIIMGNLGFILIGAGDVFVAGRHSTNTLAAISIATAILNCIFTFGIGLISSVSPILSNYRGERKSAKKYFYPTIRFAIFLAVLTIILFILIKNKKIGVSIFSNLAIITALNQLLKNILQRPRPTEYRIIEETGYSFPSGHSMISMAFYGYLIYLIYKYVKNKYVKWTSMVLLSILICSIGISRIYLGVHYTSDVLGGFLISISYLVIYISAVNKFLIEK